MAAVTATQLLWQGCDDSGMAAVATSKGGNAAAVAAMRCCGNDLTMAAIGQGQQEQNGGGSAQ